MKKRKCFFIHLLVIIGLILTINGCVKDDGIEYEYITDIEGNRYKTIKIGNLVWMAENLKGHSTPLDVLKSNVATNGQLDS